MKTIFIIVLLAASFNLSGQKIFISENYSYSFIVPDGWYLLENTLNPEFDAQIVDKNGNSFLVSINTDDAYPDSTATQLYEGVTTRELEEKFNPIFGKTDIVKRGTVFFDTNEFYFFYMITPHSDDHYCYHKIFMYNDGKHRLIIHAYSLEKDLIITNPAFDVMLSIFEFSSLKQK